MEINLRSKFKCSECGVDVYRLLCQVKNNVFCSKKCVGAAKRHGSTLHCAMCDASFYRRFGEQDRGERVLQFCSRPCYADWRFAKMKAKTYPKGDGGVHRHRIVAESIIGRELKPEEVVHHIDENRKNFHPMNLALLPSQKIHAKIHFGKVSRKEVMRYCLGLIGTAESALKDGALI